MRNPLSQCLSLLLMLGVLAGCGAPRVLTINERQTLVLDAPLLSAGITAGNPSLATVNGEKRASSVVSNSTRRPVTVHYRFYWYDDKGLDVLPYEAARTLVIPPEAEISVVSTRGNPDVRQVRLHLFL
ncbi:MULTISPECIES: YcfL family protein [Brenneria]|uniref:DUF1425 domain-containing protein n=1 Tax=Brenneria nigrifluens DSM 30175 = ATCC 13028 TaxID=1121120 RepID=A0A2U1US82_9GAMM|nr:MULTISPECIES: DUF1425 domain-containing protein [Brenneria]EHD21046.1 protein of unknown function DUF1425 [Brenneria sp. EniD312]PWC24471.1 DUF1425 domain-containing protein [Brenneria nigrifluens DSM 30175 = ATCC 13028]QCR04199.1 DUF1425 domain-containing protein [Brenneria nigrifluens DSM 30175 = ATCC 13028]